MVGSRLVGGTLFGLSEVGCRWVGGALVGGSLVESQWSVSWLYAVGGGWLGGLSAVGGFIICQTNMGFYLSLILIVCRDVSSRSNPRTT